MAAVLLAGTFVIGRWSSPVIGPSAASAASSVPAPVTVAAQRRTVQQIVDVTATIGYANTTTIKLGAPSGASIVTDTPVRADAEVSNGSTALEINGRPLIILAGTVPAYRDIPTSGSGRDVTQLVNALQTLGYPVSGHRVNSATINAVADLYRKLGYPSAGADGVLIPRNEVAFIPHLPAVIEGPIPAVGDAAPSQLTFASGPLTLRVHVPPGVGQIAKGDAAAITCQGTSIDGIIAGDPQPAGRDTTPAAGQPINSPGAADVTATGAVATVATDHPLTATMRSSTCLGTVVTAHTDRPVLAVPVTALYTAADGTVTVHPNGRDPMTVTVGMVAGGWAEITNPPQALGVGTLLVAGGNGNS